MFLRRHRSLCSHPFCDAQGPSYSSNKSDGVAVVTYRFRGTLLPWLARFTAVANPRSLQQIDKIADGRYRRAAEAQQRRREQQAAAQKAAMTGRAAAAAAEAQRKPLGAGDVCPICQDDMTKDEVLTFCPACGNNIHTDCMKMWSEHRQGTGEVVTCPLCREAWGPRCVVVLAQACIIFARGHLTSLWLVSTARCGVWLSKRRKRNAAQLTCTQPLSASRARPPPSTACDIAACSV